jgi:hypothetical protein
MNYSSLGLQIQSYAYRNDQTFINAIPDIITQAVIRIYSEAKLIGFQKVVNNTMVIGQNTIPKPTDYKETVSLQITIEGDNPFTKFLYDRTYEFCIAYAPNPNLRGLPEFYSRDLIVPPMQVGPANIFIAPTPDIAYPYQLTYVSYPPAFDVNNPTNFLTDKYPNLLIYACMVEAIPYLKADERIPVWESLYNRALQAANTDTKGSYTDRLTDRGKD